MGIKTNMAEEEREMQNEKSKRLSWLAGYGSWINDNPLGIILKDT